MPHPLLLSAFQSVPAFREALDRLPMPGGTVRLGGLAGSAAATLIAALHRARRERIWTLVAPTPDAAEQAHADLEALLGEGAVYLYPQREALPYEAGEPHLEVGGARVEALEALLAGRAAMLVTTARAVQELAPAVEGLADLRLQVAVGEEIRLADLAARLESMGFERVGTVEAVGQFAIRGGILDVFGFGSPEPARVEFWGDTVESIRYFDLLSQLSLRPAETLELLPVDLQPLPQSENRNASDHGARRSLLDYLPPFAVLVHLGGAAADEWRRTWTEVRRLHDAERARGGHPEPPDQLFLAPDDASRRVGSFPQLVIAGSDAQADIGFHAEPPPRIDRDMQRLRDVLHRGAAAGAQTIVLCDNQGQLDRLQELLDELGAGGGATLSIGSLAGGFVLADAEPPLQVLTDHEIFRRSRRVRRGRRFRGGAALESIAALKPGDYVVHMDHGVGKFAGLERVHLGEEEYETLVIEYAGGETLRVPVHRVDLIERWVSDVDQDAPPPKVHRIGGKDWGRTKARTQRAIETMTAELLELYAAREAEQGYEFSADSRWQREMESAFLFEDTPDQRQATEDVKRDMERSRPMDRLICGDVGYGKTEIAIRAAFKAIQDGKQVAVLVPTTILAEQHLHTFSARLADFPVRIAALSRFRTAKEQAVVLQQVAAGEVDLVIGTHRLLSGDVRFKDLGLIVVDEEQRFGVKHKERLKQLRRTVDVLTLTATPIPRTLQFSLLGLRDMTLIQTPPRDRQPIITHVLPWSDAVLEDAVRRELDRGGQVFFVHNRVETIATVAKRVEDLVPDARVGIAHGQMREAELEGVMTHFLEGEINVLVATAIIESGLDVPSANTLIVNRADQFGLAQLYQIRGRVGRSHHRAYCYLVVPDDVSEEAEKRLRVLEHYTELGSGYRIALKDLELRGAGNILGSEQSGFVHAVGFDTYMRLVEETVRRMRAGDQPAQQPLPEVSVDFAALIPESYIPDDAQKLHFYRRLARAESTAELEALRRELRDRFGPPPPETEALLASAGLRLLGRDLGIERIVARPWDVRLNFRSGSTPSMLPLQRALAGRQFEVEVRRTIPLSLALIRRGVEPILPALVGALSELVRDSARAA